MAELGQTDDPKQLVPGDDGALIGIAASLRSRGDELALAGKGLQRIDTSDGWSGAAADAFRAKFTASRASGLKRATASTARRRPSRRTPEP